MVAPRRVRAPAMVAAAVVASPGGVAAPGVGLLLVYVALPLWALTAGDVNQAARWAPILGFPLTALGLVLLLTERDRGRIAPDPASAQPRRPWMAPPLDRMVERPELGDRLVAALTAPGPAEVGLTTGLAGAGGFGKTRLATWVCHRPEIARRYPGGLLWVTVGQEVRGADLAERVNDLAFTLSGERPAISDPDMAGAELGRLLDEREPVLLVVDDVWEDAQLRPFRFGGRCCTRLVTTRIPDLLPAGGARIPVDAMSGDQARRLVADGVPGLPVSVADRLAELAGRWPVLLNLVNGALRRRVGRGQLPERAAAEIVETLAAKGPVAFDPARPADRSRAVAATVEASLLLLAPADREHYFDLAVFPEDVDIPLDVLSLLWPGCRVDALSEELVALGLVADYRLDPPGPRLVLHDVMRAYLQTRRAVTEQASVHCRLVAAAAALLPACEEDSAPWWLLPPDAGYLWRYLPQHLHHAGRFDDLAGLACDLRWVEAKTLRFGSVVAVEADLQLVDTPTAAVLGRALRQAAHLLGPIDPPNALGATLATHWVRSCAFSPDGSLLATGGADKTVRLWQVSDRSERAVLIGHTGWVQSCAFSPDGALLATASDDGTVRLWQVADGTERAVLRGHTDGVTGCAFFPNGTLLATTSDDGTVRLWQVADGTTDAVLTGHTSWVERCALSPDGALLATTGRDGTMRMWQVSSGRCQCAMRVAGPLSGVAWHPCGTMLCTTGGAGVYMFNYLP